MNIKSSLDESSVSAIKELHDKLHAEWSGHQVVGRPLTDQEKKESEKLQRYISALNEVETVHSSQINQDAILI